MMKASILSTLLLLTLTANAADIAIRSDKFANWLLPDESITFKAQAPLPDAVKTVNALLVDSDGQELEQSSITAAKFNASGWSWKPKTSGFFTAKFTAVDAEGKESPLGESSEASVKRWNAGKETIVAKKNFLNDTHGIAVLPKASRKPADVPPQFGVSLGWYMDKNKGSEDFMTTQARVSALLGAHSARLHCITLWNRCEPKQGSYDWQSLDLWLNTLKSQGFEDFTMGLMGTAKWAVGKPDEGVLLIPNYLGQPPKDITLWTNFVTALQKRYHFIRKWELWNEPGFKGQSCFWYGDPEEFCELLKATYETIKLQQPDAVCFIGCPCKGFGQYLVEQGYDKYYDAIATHGKKDPKLRKPILPQPQTKENPKPETNLEWHAILTSASDYPYPSEAQLSKCALLSFMDMRRRGVDAAYIYGPLGYSNNMDILDFNRQNGNTWTHNFGFFSLRQDYVQPRLPAVIWRNFTDLFSGNVTYGAGFAFDEQCAALMESSAGKVLILWQNGKSPAKLNPELAEALGKNSEILDWEGRRQAPKDLLLQPVKMLFLKNPDMDAVGRWGGHSAQVLYVNIKTPELQNHENGIYRQGRIFNDFMKTVQPEKLRWNKAERYVSFNGKSMAEGFSARYALSLDDTGLDLLVDVTDSIHHPSKGNGGKWEGDSIQFAIDSSGAGYVDDKIEFIAALSESGAELIKLKAPFDGFLPANCTMAGGPVKNATTTIERNAWTTIYKIHLPSNELHPFRYEKGKLLRFSLLVNNNDDGERAGWLEWASGIGTPTTPEEYGNLTVDIGETSLLDPKSLEKWRDATLEKTETSLKITSEAGDKNSAAGLMSKKITMEPGARYLVSFQARGDVRLEGFISSPRKNERIDFLKPTQLSQDFKNFELPFVCPPHGVSAAQLFLFCWRQNGSFEIKDFKLTAP